MLYNKNIVFLWLLQIKKTYNVPWIIIIFVVSPPILLTTFAPLSFFLLPALIFLESLSLIFIHARLRANLLYFFTYARTLFQSPRRVLQLHGGNYRCTTFPLFSFILILVSENMRDLPWAICSLGKRNNNIP